MRPIRHSLLGKVLSYLTFFCPVGCEAQGCIRHLLSTRLSSSGCFLCAAADRYLFPSLPVSVEITWYYRKRNLVCQGLFYIVYICSIRSAMHLLARLQRTRSVGRLPYKDLGGKILMKTRFQRFFRLNLCMAELLLYMHFLLAYFTFLYYNLAL